MNCPKCNAANSPEARFCGSCGYDLQAAPQQNTSNEPEEILEVEEVANNQPSMEQPTLEPMTNEQPVMNQPVMEQPTMEPMVNNQPMMNQPMMQQPVNQQPMNNNFQQPGLNPGTAPKKSGKTGLIILGGILGVVVIVVAVILLLKMNPSEEKQQKDKIDAIFNPDQLIKVKKDDKYGYINTKGEVEIPIAYEYATEFKGNYAVVRAEVEKDGLTRTVYQIIDNKGKVKKQADLLIEYIEETESWIIDSELYNKSMKKISPDGVRVSHKEDNYYLWVNSKENTGGIMNEKGKQIYTYKFQSGETAIYLTVPSTDDAQDDKYCIVNVNSKYGLVNCDTGKVIKELGPDRISSNTDNVFTIKNNDTYDFKEIIYVQDDKIMYQSTNEEIDLYYYTYYLSIRDGSATSWSDRYTYLDLRTGEISKEQPAAPESEEDEDENLDPWEKETKNKKFSCSTGYGLMNNDTITLQCEWSDIDYLNVDLYKYLKSNKKEYVYGEKDNKWYLIDLKEKKPIVEFNSYYITTKDNTTFIYYTDSQSDSRKVYNLLTNKSLSVDKDKSLTVYSNYITVKDSTINKLKYYNTNLEMIYEGDI